MEILPSPALLTTARLLLRPFAISDRDDFLEIVQEPDIFRYFPTQTAWQMEKVERYFSYQNAHWRKYNYGHWAVILAETNQLLGWCGLEYLPDTNETEVGYLLSRAFWGKGYATEATQTCVQFGRNEIGLKGIIGLTHPENIASQRVLEKSGLAFTRSASYFGVEMFRYSTQV